MSSTLPMTMTNEDRMRAGIAILLARNVRADEHNMILDSILEIGRNHDALLAACKRMYTLCPIGHRDDERGIWAEARAAIALAEGGVA